MPSVGNTISPTNRGPAVDITVWSCFVLSGLGVCSKVWTKYSRSNGRRGSGFRNLQWDDYVLALALVFAIVFSISVSQEVVAGLGKPTGKVKNHSIVKHEKTAYVAQVFYVSAIGTTNAAGIMFGIMLQPEHVRLYILRLIFVFNGMWYLCSLVTILLQCHIPFTWAIFSGKCIDQTAMWISIDSVVLSINIVLAATLCSIVWILQRSHLKYILVALFSSRALISIPIAFKMRYVLNISTTNPSSSHWPIALPLANEAMVSATILNAHIVLTCLPFMKHLMEYLQPGWSSSASTSVLLRGGFGSYRLTTSNNTGGPFSGSAK